MTYVGDNGDSCKYTRSDQKWDVHRGFLFWSDAPVQPVAQVGEAAINSTL